MVFRCCFFLSRLQSLLILINMENGCETRTAWPSNRFLTGSSCPLIFPRLCVYRRFAYISPHVCWSADWDVCTRSVYVSCVTPMYGCKNRADHESQSKIWQDLIEEKVPPTTRFPFTSFCFLWFSSFLSLFAGFCPSSSSSHSIYCFISVGQHES